MKLKELLTLVVLVTVLGLATTERSEVYDYLGKDATVASNNDQVHAERKILTTQELSAERAWMSVKTGGLERMPSVPGEFSGMDREFLVKLKDVVDELDGVDCRRDLNFTLEAIERKEAWAVACKYCQVEVCVLKYDGSSAMRT